VSDSLSKEVEDFPRPAIIDRGVSYDSRVDFGSPPPFSSPTVAPYYSFATSDSNSQSSPDKLLPPPQASVTASPSTTGSSPGTSPDWTQRTTLMQDTEQGTSPVQSNPKFCQLCQEMFDGSQQLV
jgi:hypothetical protein